MEIIVVHELIRQLVLWIYQHPTWAGFALFLLSAGESMTLIGSFIPGTIVMTAVGIFIGADLLPYWPMALWAGCGALCGDVLNFSLGYLLKDNIKHVWPFKKYPHWLHKGQYFFEVHGGKSIYFARFIGPLRAFAPIIAGAMRMSPSKFYIIDTLSAFTWSIVYLLPGVLLGEASLQLSSDITDHLFRYALMTLVLAIVAGWIIQLLILHINDVVKNALSCLWTKIKETPSLSFVRHWMHHYQTDHPRGQLGTLFVFVVIFSCFIVLTIGVSLSWPALLLYNSELHHLTQSLRTPNLDHVMLMITMMGEKKIILVMVLLASVWMAYRRCWRAVFFLLGSCFLGVFSAYFLKDWIQFHRPLDGMDDIHGFSYPSGHVMIAMIFYGGLAYLAAAHLKEKSRCLFYLGAIVLILLVICSRLLLGVHWMTDVVGSILLGWSCLLLMAFFYQRDVTQNIQPIKLFPLLIVIQLILTGGYYQHTQSRLDADYALNYHPEMISIDIHTHGWWNNNALDLPSISTNRLGVPKELLNLQWMGKQESIETLLISQGWNSLREHRNWVLELENIEEKPPTPHPNVKVRYFDDKSPTFIFYKAFHDFPQTFMVLQLWQTQYFVEPAGLPLFVGTLNVKAESGAVKHHINSMELIARFKQSLPSNITLSTKTSVSGGEIILIRDKNHLPVLTAPVCQH